jgi:two-component system chemotaxis response regulator CheB
MPVIMISTLTMAGADITLEALEVGAVDFVPKPTVNVADGLAELAAELQVKVKAAANMRVGVRHMVEAPPARHQRPIDVAEKLIAIGASTGGVEALKRLLMGMPAACPPILITQHMPPRFTAAFAERLNRECPMTVSEAKHHEMIQPNHVYIAPGSHHLELSRFGGQYRCCLSEGPIVSGHRPSVDVLFRSVAHVAGKVAVGVILTGMGKDGAEGLRALREAGGTTLGQDEASSLVYGMPRVALERGAVMRQYPLSRMADAILDACDPHVRSRLQGVQPVRKLTALGHP